MTLAQPSTTPLRLSLRRVRFAGLLILVLALAGLGVCLKIRADHARALAAFSTAALEEDLRNVPEEIDGPENPGPGVLPGEIIAKRDARRAELRGEIERRKAAEQSHRTRHATALRLLPVTGMVCGFLAVGALLMSALAHSRVRRLDAAGL